MEKNLQELLTYLAQAVPTSVQYVAGGWLWSWVQITHLGSLSLNGMDVLQLVAWASMLIVGAAFLGWVVWRFFAFIWALWQFVATAISVAFALVLTEISVGAGAWVLAFTNQVSRVYVKVPSF